jgi:hypothetical protein
MRRGVIHLTKNELREAFRLTEASRNHTLLLQKLTNAKNKPEDEAPLQVTEEDLEMLLDCVGIPTVEEPEERKSLRMKIHVFLRKLRQELQ